MMIVAQIWPKLDNLGKSRFLAWILVWGRDRYYIHIFFFLFAVLGFELRA
jgi:hypothetical protein